MAGLSGLYTIWVSDWWTDWLIALIHQWIDLFIGNNADETNNKGFLSTLIHTKGKIWIYVYNAIKRLVYQLI